MFSGLYNRRHGLWGTRSTWNFWFGSVGITLNHLLRIRSHIYYTYGLKDGQGISPWTSNINWLGVITESCALLCWPMHTCSIVQIKFGRFEQIACFYHASWSKPFTIWIPRIWPHQRQKMYAVVSDLDILRVFGDLTHKFQASRLLSVSM